MNTTPTLQTKFLATGIVCLALTSSTVLAQNAVVHDTIEIDGVEVFYREAGSKDAPTLFLLHGYPTSSHMFRNLMRDLADKYHTLAPDYPGFGRSEQPPMAEFAYTFDHMAELMEKFLNAKGVEKFSLYLMDYGAPIGYRIALKHPDRSPHQ